MMTVKEIETKAIWDIYLEKFPKRTFLQTWQWGDFQFKSLEKKTLRLGLFKDDVLVGLALCIEEQNRFGKFLYSPRGPLCNKKDLEDCLKCLKEYTSKKRYAFFRCDPEILAQDTQTTGTFKRSGFKSAANFVQVQRCWIMELEGIKNEEEMFTYAKNNGMSTSIPRHIRKSAKQGVATRISTELSDINILLDVLHSLAQRKGIPQRPDEYYKEMFKYLAPDGFLRLIIAEYRGEPISTILLATYNGEVATLHGATKENISPNLYVAKKIYWDAIMYALQNGYSRFNYWGVLSKEQMDAEPNHPSFGYSLFKRRMGGKEMLLMDTQDLPINWFAWKATYLLEKYRKMKYKVD